MCVKRVPCSWDITFFFSTLNFPLMISSPTLPPFFQVPASKVPAPTQKFPGVTVTGRHTLGLQGGLGVGSPAGGEGHRAMMGRAGQNRKDGGSGEQVYNQQWR